MARRGDEVLRRRYSAVWIRAAWWQTARPFEAPFDPPMLGFLAALRQPERRDGSRRREGLYGDDTVTTKEVLKVEK